MRCERLRSKPEKGGNFKNEAKRKDMRKKKRVGEDIYLNNLPENASEGRECSWFLDISKLQEPDGFGSQGDFKEMELSASTCLWPEEERIAPHPCP